MNSVKRLKLNSILGFMNQITILISGLILPRLILVNFGSEVNGLTASIAQFLTIIRFMELGVGTVVQTSLYRPIAEKDTKKINTVLASARDFFNKISILFIIYVLLLMVVFPNVVDSPLDYLSTSFLVFAMSISLLAQYYLGMVNRLFLNANQQNYLSMYVSIATVILNMVATILLIQYGASIQIVKLMTSMIYLIRPLYLKYYINKNYNFIDYDTPPSKNAIPQKWNGMAQHISVTVMDSADMIILTMFSTLENISIYAIHNLVVNGVSQLVQSTTSGLSSFFGNLLAQDDLEQTNLYFDKVEWIIHTITTYIFGMTAILITPFILIYTKGVQDVSYNVPLFAFIITISQAIRLIRVPYNMIVFSAGHYKQTQNSSIIETALNIILSILAVTRFGLIGIIIGTIVALSYRQLYLIQYLSRNIVYRPVIIFIKQILVNFFSFSIIIFLANILNIQVDSVLQWIIYASGTGIVYAIIMIFVNYLFYPDYLKYYFEKFLKRK